MKRTLLIAMLVSAYSLPSSAQVNRCNIDGQLSWQSQPCPAGTALEGSEELPGGSVNRDPAVDLAYRTVQQIERAHLSFQRCRREETGGCTQFVERFTNDLAPQLLEAQQRMDLIAASPAAQALIRRHQDDLNAMTDFMRAAQRLSEGINTLE